MDKVNFFSVIKKLLFKNRLNQGHVDGLEAILDYYLGNYPNPDLDKLAYICATAYHETAATMRPIEEYGKGKGYAYGKKLTMSRKAYSTPDKLYYGRGLVQLTWYENYLRVGKLLNIDLLNHPEYMLTLEVSVPVLVRGMMEGWFTGKKLSMFVDKEGFDFENARKIVNGLDKAESIAAYAVLFREALKQPQKSLS